MSLVVCLAARDPSPRFASRGSRYRGTRVLAMQTLLSSASINWCRTLRDLPSALPESGVRYRHSGSADMSRWAPRDYSLGTQCDYVLNPARVPL
jgi:hypothetical protein